MKVTYYNFRILIKNIFCCLFLSLLLSACGGTNNESVENTPQNASSGQTISVVEKDGIRSASTELFAMDTFMTIECWGDNAEAAVKDALKEIKRLDDLLSTGNPESEISRLNVNGEASLSEDTAEIISKALGVAEETKGAFDPTIYPLMQAWGFTTGEFKVPDKAEIQDLLEKVDYRKVQYDAKEAHVSLADGQGIDLGGIAKGFTSDRLMNIFAEYGLQSGLVSLGGNVECLGTKTDGSLWRCAIQNPLQPDNKKSYLGILEIADEAVITSGAYERNFTDEKSGITYHHILDPKTGYPANNGIISASIVSSSGILADSLSTSCYIMGLNDSIDFWREHRDDFEMVLMTDDHEVYITEGLKDTFKTEFPLHIITSDSEGQNTEQ